MKKFLLFLISLACVSSYAGNKIDLNGLSLLEDLKTKNKVLGASGTSPRIEAIALMNGGVSEETFLKYDAEITARISDEIVVVNIPAANAVAFSEEESVKYLEFGNIYTADMDYARSASNVDEAHAGFNIGGATFKYDGTGVVTGLMDSGLDPNHPNFLTKDGRTRVKAFYNYDSNTAATTPEEVEAITTDNAAGTHGTHVAGIMAGKAYSDRARYCTIPSPTGGDMAQRMGVIPFYGVATGSDIVMASGTFSETNLIKGAQAMADYAQKEGKPFVLNFSLSKSDGPHDGSGAFEKAISIIGKKGIICVSSGNNGKQASFAGKKFAGQDKTMSTFIKDNACSGIDIWGSDERPLTVTLWLYRNGTLTSICSISEAGKTAYPSQEFSENMNGYFTLRSEVNALNNRYHVRLSGDFNPKGAGAEMAISVSGADGQQAHCYGCGSLPTQFSSNGIQGYAEGSCNGNVNNMATAENVVCVGAYNTSYAWGAFDGYTYNLTPTSEYAIGHASAYTAYGATFQGTNLPHVCAPGTAIKSSYNRYYTSRQSDEEAKKYCARIDKNVDIKAYWGTSTGTSMASPFAAGTIALWLEADPSLTIDDVLSILQSTSEKPADCTAEESLQWGAGKINGLEGLKETLSRKSSSLAGAVSSDDVIIAETGNGVYSISSASSTSITARLYNLQGVTVAYASSACGEVTLDACGRASGVCILQVSPSNSAPVTKRVMLR